MLVGLSFKNIYIDIWLICHCKTVSVWTNYSLRNYRWVEWITSVLSTFNTTTEVRPLSKTPNPQLLPGSHSIGCPLLRVCVCVCVCVCAHLDGLNAEHKFRVRVTILGQTCGFLLYLWGHWHTSWLILIQGNIILFWWFTITGVFKVTSGEKSVKMYNSIKYIQLI